jgi:hypothetical protein
VFGDGGRRSRQCWATVGDGGVEVGVLYYVEGALPRLGAGGALKRGIQERRLRLSSTPMAGVKQPPSLSVRSSAPFLGATPGGIGKAGLGKEGAKGGSHIEGTDNHGRPGHQLGRATRHGADHHRARVRALSQSVATVFSAHEVARRASHLAICAFRSPIDARKIWRSRRMAATGLDAVGRRFCTAGSRCRNRPSLPTGSIETKPNARSNASSAGSGLSAIVRFRTPFPDLSII